VNRNRNARGPVQDKSKLSILDYPSSKKPQKAQNRMLRTLTGTWQIDRVSIKDMLEQTNTLSVNQTAAQVKLCEMWNASKLENDPVKIERIELNGVESSTTQSKKSKFKEKVRSK
jgi:hypothetical protein